MTDKRPSDRAIAQAFWEWRTRSNYFRAKYSASIWVEERARELDATAAPVVVGEDAPAWVDDEMRLTMTLRNLLKDKPLYLMGREHVEQKTKPLAEIYFGMTSELGVLFCMKDTEAPIPVDPAMTAALAGD